eukprot:TRINITY_DN52944_c0_g1_i1.p1 TRINITY_DN52944_c0_g1~~TRINITY_DN52944_c0_g1_i1.p1  ORF type:complete len:332 (+),score=60.19 TRINITY_DN52944_c0_g1_i1:166-1161(+)
MPAEPLTFRPKCGCFVSIFLNFMCRRAKNKIVIRTLRMRNMQAGVVVGLLLVQFFYGDLLQRCGDIESNPGPIEGKKDKSDNLRQTRLQRVSQSGGASTSPSHHAADSVSKGQPSLSDILETINSMNVSLNKKMDDVNDNLNRKLDDVMGEVNLLRGQYAELQEEVGQLRGEMDSLRQENQDLAKKMDDLQGRSKRNNIIVYGMVKLENETSATCEGVLNDMLTDKLEMSESVQFDRVHRINSRPDSPVIACCTFFRQKQAILKAKRKLQGTDLFIGEDFTERVRGVRKRLIPHLRKARADGKRATLVFDHLVIESVKFGLDNRNNLVEVR